MFKEQTMPRLNQVDPVNDTGPGAEFLNGPLKNKQINIFKGLATNPGVLKAFIQFSGGVRHVLDAREHEMIALVVGQKNKCDYCLAAHTQMAQAAGISEDLALKIRSGEAGNERHQALVDFTTVMLETNGFVSDDQLEAFRNAGYDDAAIIEVVAAIAVNTFSNLFNHVNETEVDFPEPTSV